MRLARLDEAAEITEQPAAEAGGSVQVAWLGRRPDWVDELATSQPFAGVAIASAVSSETQVVHVGREAGVTPAEIRAAHPGAAVVVDLGAVNAAGEETLFAAAGADIVLVESELDARRARERSSALDRKLTVSPTPIDVEHHAPEAVLNRLPGAYIRRFRRLHRLADPTVLFVGPYVDAGGLDLAIAAAYRLRERFADLRLAAIPLGQVDQKYLDRCEMEALALGHRGIVEWSVADDDLRCWYATATVVCSPWRDAAAPPVAPTFAAAAARPFVGSDLEPFRSSLRPPEAPDLVPPGDVEALVDALAPLLADGDLATRVGTSARATVESVYSYEAAATRLAAVWRALATRSLPEVA